MTSSKSRHPAHFFQPNVPPKTVVTTFDWNFLLVGVFSRSPSQKNIYKILTGKRDKNFAKKCLFDEKIASGKFLRLSQI